MELKNEFSLPKRTPAEAEAEKDAILAAFAKMKPEMRVIPSLSSPSVRLGLSQLFLLLIRGEDVRTVQADESAFMGNLISGVQESQCQSYKTSSVGSILVLSERGYSLVESYHSSMGYSPLSREGDQAHLPALEITAKIVPHCPTGFLAVFAPRDSYVIANCYLLPIRPDAIVRLVNQDWNPNWVTLPASNIL